MGLGRSGDIPSITIERLISPARGFLTAGKDAPELLFGGADIRGPIEALGDRHVWYRTLVQSDGDLCLSIHPDALKSASLEDDLRHHIGHVKDRLAGLKSAYRFVRNLPLAAGVPALGVTSLKLCFELVAGGRGLVDILHRDPMVFWGLVVFLLMFFVRLLGPRLVSTFLRHLALRRFGDPTAR